MAGDRNPFDEEEDVNPFSDPAVRAQAGGGFYGGASYNVAQARHPQDSAFKISPLPPERNNGTEEESPFSALGDIKRRERELKAKEEELKRKEQVKIVTRSCSRKIIEEFRELQKKAKEDGSKEDGSNVFSLPGVAAVADRVLAEYKDKEYEYKIYHVKDKEGDELFYIKFGQIWYTSCVHSTLKEAKADLSPLASAALWGIMLGDNCYAFPNAKLCRYNFRKFLREVAPTEKIIKVYPGKVRINLEGFTCS